MSAFESATADTRPVPSTRAWSGALELHTGDSGRSASWRPLTSSYTALNRSVSPIAIGQYPGQSSQYPGPSCRTTTRAITWMVIADVTPPMRAVIVALPRRSPCTAPFSHTRNTVGSLDVNATRPTVLRAWSCASLAVTASVA